MAGRGRSGLVRRLAVTAVGVLVAVAMLPTAEAEVARAFEGFGLISPVGIVRGADSDQQTERLVRDVLARAGIRRVVETDGTQPRTQLTVWLGDGTAPLAALGSKTADRLPADSYVLAVGKDPDGRGHVVLDGADADGTFYAAHALAGLVQRRKGPDFLPPTQVLETPSMRYRGVVEGFYGTPWSYEERLDLLDFMGRHRMNTYEYAPKDDPYQRKLWRDPYPEEKRSQLATMVRRARENRIDVGFTVSPGLSICYSSEQDFKALTAKLDAIYALGVRSFTLGFDDIEPGEWHCAADERAYADKPGAAAEAQAALLSRIQLDWANGKPDIAALRMVPTEYDSITDSPYKKVLRARLRKGVGIYWSGVANIPRSVSRDQAAQAARVFGHEIILWDNYPANDYIAGRIPLGAYSGRENGLSGEVAGVLSNPMNQSALSKIALSAVGEFTWDDEEFDPAAAWTRALAEQAGGDRRVAGALRWFADVNNFDGALHYARSPVLSDKLAVFWTAWDNQDRSRAAADLRRTLAEIARAPQLIRQGVDDPLFATQAAGWLDATELWARAMQASLAALVAVEQNDFAAAADARAAATDLVERTREIRDTRRPHAGHRLMIGDGVMDEFVARVDRAVDTALGIGLDRPEATASMDAYAGHEPAAMLDGDKGTYYSSARAPRVGDFVQVDLRREHEIGEVRLQLAYANAPKNYLRSGVVEYSTDAETWTVLARGDTDEVVAKAPKGTRARYVRYRAATANAPYWLVVREFDVEVLDRTTLSVDDSGDSGDSADSGDSGDSAESGDSGDSAESGDSGDSAESGDSSDSADSADSGDSGDSGDSSEDEGGDSGDREGSAGGDGSGSAAAAVDGDSRSSYRDAGSDDDEGSLVVTLSTPRSLERVSVLQASGETSKGTLEVRRNGEWKAIGQVDRTYTSIPVRDRASIEAVRLRWSADAAAPRVAEIIPHYLPD